MFSSFPLNEGPPLYPRLEARGNSKAAYTDDWGAACGCVATVSGCAGQPWFVERKASSLSAQAGWED